MYCVEIHTSQFSINGYHLMTNFHHLPDIRYWHFSYLCHFVLVCKIHKWTKKIGHIEFCFNYSNLPENTKILLLTRKNTGPQFRDNWPNTTRKSEEKKFQVKCSSEKSDEIFAR